MPDFAPQTHGKVKIDYTPGQAAEISVDGYRLEQHVTALTLKLDATEKPVLILELLPSSVDVTADHVTVSGEFRDFLLTHGWRPPQ
jgi:hypothetical protein